MLDLEAIELIKQLKARYFRFLDTCDLEGMKTVFTDDGEALYKSPSYELNFKGWQELEAFFGSTFTGESFGMHTVHHPEITVDGDTATGLWYLHDIFIHEADRMQVEGSAIYKDEYVKVNGEWKMSYTSYDRLLETMSVLPETTKITCRPVR